MSMGSGGGGWCCLMVYIICCGCGWCLLVYIMCERAYRVVFVGLHNMRSMWGWHLLVYITCKRVCELRLPVYIICQRACEWCSLVNIIQFRHRVLCPTLFSMSNLLFFESFRHREFSDNTCSDETSLQNRKI